MFFDAQKRLGTKDFNYERSIALQYGNNGKPIQIPKVPKASEIEAAMKFRQKERLEYEQMKARLAEVEDQAYILAKHFLEEKE